MTTISLRRPVTWADPLPYTGCRLCDYGRTDDTLPEFWGDLCYRQRMSPTGVERARGGACGPDAKYLTIKGDTL